ncbi:unnamed protein product [Cyprideis torosa]|uniref:Uncharacterized protein n=1 Tax=Cyprideis torosa TaxID=163714 RepID=A0A7R8WKC3_9CRUS|nr:unnamed protein product [Cyprideis torosa]CAG0896777.1 unnamed protein product [Cyprideis torosa]
MKLATFLFVSLSILGLATAYLGLSERFSITNEKGLGSERIIGDVCRICGGVDAILNYNGPNPLSCPAGSRMLDFEALLTDPTNRASSKSNALTRAIHKLAQQNKQFNYTVQDRIYGNGYQLIALFCEPPALRCEGLPCEPSALNCDFSSRYRTIDGLCNNGAVWTWGATMTAMRRVLPSAYRDHHEEPRGGHPSSSLPSAREISLLVHPDQNVQHPQITLMFMQFGQFMDHDISLMPIEEDGNRREQFNEITAFIDASNVYGSSAVLANALRTHVDGKLKSGTTPSGGMFLPTNTLSNLITGQFMAGDVRVNEQPGLTVMHALFLREHNRIAQIIKNNPNLPNDDETIYQETRRIIGAELQKILYQDYLPLLVGPNIWTSSALNPRDDIFNIGVDPSISNTFATAAFRGKPDDIELFPAMVSETPVSGGVVGRTAACIIAEQFERLRYGDRFFFANYTWVVVEGDVCAVSEDKSCHVCGGR